MQPNTSTPLFQTVFNSLNTETGAGLSMNDFVAVYTVNPAYDCVMQMLLGFSKLLNVTGRLPTDLASRSLQSFMNYTLFRDLGYNGLSGAPISLNEEGDLESAGSSTPPADGPPIITIPESVISTSDSTGALILFYASSSLTGCIGALLFTVWYRHERVIKESGFFFLLPLVSGYTLLSVSLFCFMDRVSVITCVGRIWLQVIGFGSAVGILLAKVEPRSLSTGVSKKKRGNRVVGLMVAILILLSLWTFLQPHSIQQLEFPTYTIYICIDPGYSNPFTIALLVVNIILLATTTLFSFTHSDVSKDRYPAVLTTSFAFTCLIMVPLLATADPTLNATISYATSIWCLVWIALLSVFFKKVAIIIVDTFGADFGISSLLKEVVLMGSESEVSGDASEMRREASMMRRGLSSKRKEQIHRENSKSKGLVQKKKRVKAKSLVISHFNRFWLLLAGVHTSIAFPIQFDTLCKTRVKPKSVAVVISSTKKSVWKSMQGDTTVPSNFRVEIDFADMQAAEGFIKMYQDALNGAMDAPRRPQVPQMSLAERRRGSSVESRRI
ncbi:hypothetical protein HDU98_006168, partial [Podochytrium sp. JEL0797]